MQGLNCFLGGVITLEHFGMTSVFGKEDCACLSNVDSLCY